MSDILLTTKLVIPAVKEHVVARPRLIERLESSLDGRLTLLSAPAGFGKTTLLSSWLRQSNHLAAWISLDEGDNDPVRFLTYLGEALIGIQAGIEQAEAPFRANFDSALGLEPINAMAALINHAAAFSEPFVVVMDDYHVITNERIHQEISYLLEHQPPQMHLVIASRADPPLPLALLRGRGQLNELRQEDLRFTSEESAQFLVGVMGIELDAPDLETLAARTEGWIAGLQLAAISMRGYEDKAGFVQTFAGDHRYILDYLVEQVFDRQPVQIQEFLLSTSILDRFNSDLCDYLLEASKSDAVASLRSQTILEQLERSNLFLVSLDDQRHWYRYHHLFRDVLRARAAQTCPKLLPALHCQAASWYKGHGMVEEAIEHALGIPDYVYAADLIEEVVEETIMRSEVATLLYWVAAIPDEIIFAHSTLCIYHAWALLLSGNSIEEVESRLQRVEGDGTDLASVRVMVLRGFVAAYQGNPLRAAELSRQALMYLPEDELFLRSIVAYNMGIAKVWEGERSSLADGIRALSQAVELARRADSMIVGVAALCQMAEMHYIQGRLTEAEALFQRANDMAVDRYGKPFPIAGAAEIGLGELLRERNQLDLAERYLQEGIRRTLQWGRVGAQDGYISLARLYAAQGDLDLACRQIDEALQLATRFDLTELDDYVVEVHQARLWIERGELEKVDLWQDRRGMQDGRIFSSQEERVGGLFVRRYLDLLEQLTLVRLLFVRGAYARILEILPEMAPEAERYDLAGCAVEIQAFRAMAMDALGEREAAFDGVNRALSKAERHGYQRLLIDLGTPLRELLAAYHEMQPVDDPLAIYVLELLASFEGVTPTGGQAIAPGFSAETGQVDMLSERESQILRLIAAGYSNREIADELYIAISTVKTHINNIYGKLGVPSRTRAVARARELGIL